MKVLLIPSAVLVPKDMRRNFGDLPTGLFPLGDKPMLKKIYDKYKNSVDKIYVAVYKKYELIENYLAAQKLPIELIYLDKLGDLGYTVRYSLDSILKKNTSVEYLYINFADSLLDDEIQVGLSDYLYYAKQEWSSDWTYFQSENGHLKTLFDKENFIEGTLPVLDTQQIFIGVFGISDSSLFLNSFDRKSNNGLADSFYQALYCYSQKKCFLFFETENWFDVGHSENYVKAKTAVAARSFNSIQIDEQRGILSKTSENREKLIDEIKWYLRMPNKLQYLLPRIYSYSLERLNPYVSMEYYGYHTLHESLLYGDLSLSRWKEIFEKLLFVISDMETFKVEGRKDEIRLSMKNIYIDKTIMRLEKLRLQKEFAGFFTDEIVINGKNYFSIDFYLKELPKLVEKILIEKCDDVSFNIIHGDLCFTNILIEDTYNFMRFIDPRGKFGAFDIYGDSRYEMAKLLHTLEGNYDAIIEDMFEITVNKTVINYNVHSRNEKIYHIFCEVFKEKLIDLRSIQLIEATLFLSMIPLHQDSLTRQYAMLATGIKIFDEILKMENRNE